MSDIKTLARQAANGDRTAFDKLYEQTKSGVWFTCIQLLKNEENAKDIMQETYLTALEKLSTLPNFDGIQGWLNKVAANKCKDHLRSSIVSSQAEDGGELIENIPDDALFPEEYVADKAKRAIIMDIITRKLTEPQSRTVILYYFDEFTAAEIAELMGCHEKTVLYRLKTAKAKIKEEVLKYEEENNDRLHIVVPIPILTRLLKAEAESAAVPNVPLVKDVPSSSESVPQNSAAQAANAGGKTMLNSLKAKIIAGVCAAVVVGGGVTAGVLIANNSQKTAAPESNLSASSAAELSSVKESSSAVNGGYSDIDAHFIVESIDLSAPKKDKFEAELFGGVELPITNMKELGNKWYHGRDGESFETLMEDFGKVSPGFNTSIYKIYDHRVDPETETPDLNLNNFSGNGNSKITPQESLEKNWWNLETGEYKIDELFKINSSAQLHTLNPHSENTQFYNDMLAQLGAPSDVRFYDQKYNKPSDVKVAFNNDKIDMISYALIYKYSGFTITVDVMEIISINKNNEPYINTSISNVSYYTSEC